MVEGRCGIQGDQASAEDGKTHLVSDVSVHYGNMYQKDESYDTQQQSDTMCDDIGPFFSRREMYDVIFGADDLSFFV